MACLTTEHTVALALVKTAKENGATNLFEKLHRLTRANLETAHKHTTFGMVKDMTSLKIWDLGDSLASVSSFLALPSRVFFATAITAPSSSWSHGGTRCKPNCIAQVILSQVDTGSLDLGNMEVETSDRLTDDDVTAAILCIQSLRNLTQLKLARCPTINGSGFFPLLGSTALETLDLRDALYITDGNVIRMLRSFFGSGNDISLHRVHLPRNFLSRFARYEDLFPRFSSFDEPFIHFHQNITVSQNSVMNLLIELRKTVIEMSSATSAEDDKDIVMLGFGCGLNQLNICASLILGWRGVELDNDPLALSIACRRAVHLLKTDFGARANVGLVHEDILSPANWTGVRVFSALGVHWPASSREGIYRNIARVVEDHDVILVQSMHPDLQQNTVPPELHEYFEVKKVKGIPQRWKRGNLTGGQINIFWLSRRTTMPSIPTVGRSIIERSAHFLYHGNDRRMAKYRELGEEMEAIIQSAKRMRSERKKRVRYTHQTMSMHT